MKRNVNRTISWAALGLVVLTAVAVLPIVAQTTGSNAGEKAAQPDDVATTEDASVAADDAAETSSDAVTTETAATSETVEPASNAAATVTEPASGSGTAQAPSEPEILKRISRLENLLQALGGERNQVPGELPDRETVRSSDSVRNRIQRREELPLAGESPRTGRRGPSSGSSSAATVTPRLPNFEVSPNEREQELQEQLLKLDGQAAYSDLEQARIILERSEEINKNRPGTVAGIDLARQRAAVRAKEIEVERAKIVLELFKHQAQRQREASARLRRYQQRSTSGIARPQQATDNELRSRRRDELARLKELNEQVANELARLENLLKEAPDSPETWERINRFLRIYRNLTVTDATDEAESQSRSDGARP